MSVEQEDGAFLWSCNFCNAEQETAGEYFSAAWLEAKAAGWRAFKDDRGEWKRKCPACVKARK